MEVIESGFTDADHFVTVSLDEFFELCHQFRNRGLRQILAARGMDARGAPGVGAPFAGEVQSDPAFFQARADLDRARHPLGLHVAKHVPLPVAEALHVRVTVCIKNHRSMLSQQRSAFERKDLL